MALYLNFKVNFTVVQSDKSLTTKKSPTKRLERTSDMVNVPIKVMMLHKKNFTTSPAKLKIIMTWFMDESCCEPVGIDKIDIIYISSNSLYLLSQLVQGFCQKKSDDFLFLFSENPRHKRMKLLIVIDTSNR